MSETTAGGESESLTPVEKVCKLIRTLQEEYDEKNPDSRKKRYLYIGADDNLVEHKKERYANKFLQNRYGESINEQIDEQKKYIESNNQTIACLSALLAHTKRDKMKFLLNHISARLQLWLSPLDNINAKIVIPTNAGGDAAKMLEAEKLAIQKSIIGIELIPHELLRARGKRMQENYIDNFLLPEWFHNYEKNATLHHNYFADNHTTLMPLFKEFLATQVPVDYTIDDKVISSPRISKLGQGYLLIQNDPLVYDEIYLDNYTGTNLFGRYFPTKAKYLKYESNTLKQLTEQKKRFESRKTPFTAGIEKFLEAREQAIQGNKNTPFGTLTDKEIDKLIVKLTNKKNKQYHAGYISQIGKLIDDRLQAIEEMKRHITEQMEVIKK